MIIVTQLKYDRVRMSNFSFYTPIPSSPSVSNSCGSPSPVPAAATATSASSILVQNQIQLRFLNPGDYDIVKELCEEWFPVEYPAKWFEAITSDTNLFSLAAILDGKIIGNGLTKKALGNMAILMTHDF